MSVERKAVFLVFLILIILFSTFFIKVMLIPKEINLVEGNKQRFNFDIPAQAVVISNDKSVTIKEGNNTFAFSHVTLSGEKNGTAQLKLSLLGIPLKDVKVSVIPDIKLVPAGNTIGIRIDTDGIMVLGIGEVTGIDNKRYMPCSNILKSGDLILSANGKKTINKEVLIEQIEKSNGKVVLELKRNGKKLNSTINAIKCEDNKYKLGIWVRDSTQGIGTVTFYNENTNEYGALGHGITDVDTNMILSVKDGKIMHSQIKEIHKSKKGIAGELLGIIDSKKPIGTIVKNTECGIFGKINNNFEKNNYKAIPIASKGDIKQGKAKILCDVDGKGVKEYDINIESINHFKTDNSKSMVIRITDKKLLGKTNGIVQGMSGSPIIKNGKLIGAVTHVFVNDPSRGYAIFAENMLAEAEKIK